MRTKILICGATGFIGRNIAQRLARRPDLYVHAVRWDRPEFECPNLTWHRADLRDPEQADRLMDGVDVVIQAAATTSGARDIVDRPYLHVTDNAVMNSHLLRAAYEHDVSRFLFFSCSVMYPSSRSPVKEDDFDPSRPLHPRYFGVGHTKLYIERMCEFYSQISPLSCTVIRHSNIFGPHDKFDLERSHVFGATVTKVMTADDTITVWGTGEEERDLLFVEDLVDFVETSIDRDSTGHRLYNCGSGRAVSIRELVERIVAASGRSLRIEYDTSQPTIKTSLSLDCSRAREELGWAPRTSLDEGIDKTLRWWNEHCRPYQEQQA